MKGGVYRMLTFDIRPVQGGYPSLEEHAQRGIQPFRATDDKRGREAVP